MKTSEFDHFADEYRDNHARNIRASGESPEFFAEYKVADMRAFERVGRVRRILDFGGGIGNSIPYLRKHFPEADIVCLDVSARSLNIARERNGDIAEYVTFDGNRIPFGDDGFDLVLAACVFHHIEHEQHPHFLREFRRVLIPGGNAFVFEHNPFNPLTRRAVNTCEFDENAHLIRASAMRRGFGAAGFGEVAMRYRIFFPNMLAGLRPLERWLRRVPLGAQYFVAGTK